MSITEKGEVLTKPEPKKMIFKSDGILSTLSSTIQETKILIAKPSTSHTCHVVRSTLVPFKEKMDILLILVLDLPINRKRKQKSGFGSRSVVRPTPTSWSDRR